MCVGENVQYIIKIWGFIFRIEASDSREQLNLRLNDVLIPLKLMHFTFFLWETVTVNIHTNKIRTPILNISQLISLVLTKFNEM